VKLGLLIGAFESKAVCNPLVFAMVKSSLFIVFCFEFNEVFISAFTLSKNWILSAEVLDAVTEPILFVTNIFVGENPPNTSVVVGKSLGLNKPVCVFGAG
jgi:hypothetical protein